VHFVDGNRNDFERTKAVARGLAALAAGGVEDRGDPATAINTTQNASLFHSPARPAAHGLEKGTHVLSR
jgi:hypothetical protein